MQTSSRNRRSYHPGVQAHELTLGSRECNSHRIRPISRQGGGETNIMGFIACDSNIQHDG